jgi:Protein of unknown function (DUF2933)
MEGLLSFLPHALLFLLCPLMMLFMHHGDHGGEQRHHADDRDQLSRQLQASKDEVHS